jgi:hypothetical protein
MLDKSSWGMLGIFFLVVINVIVVLDFILS